MKHRKSKLSELSKAVRIGLLTMAIAPIALPAASAAAEAVPMTGTQWPALALAFGTEATALLSGEQEQAADAADDQDADADADADADEEGDTEELERVRVTGSLIKRTNADTLEPSVIIDAELIQQRGINNLADILNEAPSFGAPAATDTGTQNAFSVGQNVVGLFNLGSQRTLTVVNGRRFVSSNPPTIFSGPAGGLQVDFNSIPVALVDHLDIVAIGGAPTYGSDAIAGTINVVLNDHFEGFRFSSQYGRFTQTEPENWNVQGTWGANSADGKGNVAISVEYNVVNGVLGSERKELSVNNPFFASQDADGIRRIRREQRIDIFTAGGVVSPGATFLPAFGIGAVNANGDFLQFDTSGNLVPFQPGAPLPGSPIFAEGGDGIDLFNEVNQLQSPLKRISFTGISHYDFTPNVTAFGEFNVFNSQATELTNQGGFQTFIFGDTSFPPQFSIDNPFLTDQARGELAANGLDTFFVNRFNNDLVQNGSNSGENFLWRVVGGFEGDFTFADRDVSWEVYANFGQSNLEARTVGITDGRFINALDAVAITQEDIDELGSSLAGLNAVRNQQDVLLGGVNGIQVGDIVCGGLLAQLRGNDTRFSGNGIASDGDRFLDGCVPLNVFGENRATAGALAFIQGTQINSTNINQKTFQFDISTDLFEVPAGPVAIAGGFQHREEFASFASDGFTQLGLARSVPIKNTAGGFNTEEFFGQLEVPLVSEDMDIPGMDYLNLTGKVRNVKSSLGGSDVTYTAGGIWGVMGGLQIKGNFTQAIRSPAVVELFAPVASVFGFGNDPCDARNIDDGPDPATRRANCIAAGITDPDNFTSTVINATAMGSNGGSPDLRNEVAKSFTFGFAYVPDYVSGLNVSADYIHIDIADRIVGLNLTQIFEACFDSPDFPNEFCDRFQRDENHQVIDFQTGQANAASSQFQAVTFDINYATEVSDILGLFDDSMSGENYGNLDWHVSGIHNVENSLTVTGTDQGQVVGNFFNPKWRFTIDTSYTLDRLNFLWRIRLQDGTVLDPDGFDTFADESGKIVRKTSYGIIHNMTVSYSLTDEIVLRLVANNVFKNTGNTVQRAIGATTLDQRLGRQLLFNFVVQY